MKIVFGNVLRAEHRAKGTGGALDQSAPAMRDALNLSHVAASGQTSRQTTHFFFVPNWPGRAWPAGLAQLAC